MLHFGTTTLSSIVETELRATRRQVHRYLQQKTSNCLVGSGRTPHNCAIWEVRMCQTISSSVTPCNGYPGLLVALLAMSVLFLGQSLSAEALDGADHPDFQVSLALWLDGDETYSLRVFAELAQSDNLAAQLLLGLIDKRGALQGPETAHLTRIERIEHLRAPGGMSGRNWVSHAAERSAFAQALTDLWRSRGGVEIAQSLAEAGEARACREALLTVAARRESGLAPETVTQDWYPDGLRHLAHPRVLTPEAVADLHAGDPQRRAAGEGASDADLRDWLAESPLAMPLRAACATQCPDSAQDCAQALYTGLGSYPALVTLGSPVASLVSDADFAQSPRGQQAIARQIMLRYMMRARDQMQAKLAQIDACTADWLASKFARYAPVRSGSTPN